MLITLAAAAAKTHAATGSGIDGNVVVATGTALLGFLGVIITISINGRQANQARLRELYAGGWSAVQAYKEMAFAVRRRNIEDRAAERVRLSEAMREIQKNLAYYQALIEHQQSKRVATEYRNLVTKTRQIAGGIIRRSWNKDPISSDTEMHAPDIADELAALRTHEDAYMSAVADELRGWWTRPKSKAEEPATPTARAS